MALIEVQSGKGAFLVEVKPRPGLAGVADNDPETIIGKAEATLEQVLDSIARIGTAASEKLSQLNIDQADLEIGIKFGASGGFFFAEVAAEATLTVKISLKGKN